MANRFKKARPRTVAGVKSNNIAPQSDLYLIRAQPAGTLIPGRDSRKTAWFVSIGLLLLVSLVFFRLTGFEFVGFDDPLTVYNNLHVRNGFTVDGVKWSLADYRLFYWQPLTYLSHILDCQLFGLDAG